MLKHLFVVALLSGISLQIQAASIWKVSKGGEHIIVGGTIHLLSQSDYPLPEAYYNAYSAVDTLVFETDIAKMNTPEFQQISMQYMFLSDGKTIKDFISDETLAALKGHLASRNIPIQNFLPFRPSFLAVTLTLLELQMMGINSAGVDAYFATKGLGDGKQSEWLEEPEEQLALLADMGKGEEDAMIAYTLEDIEDIKHMMPKMINAWREGNSEELAELGIKDMKDQYPKIYQDLLVNRNRNWIPKLEALFENQQTELVLVGALHLVGEHSVLNMLQDKGYSVEKY